MGRESDKQLARHLLAHKKAGYSFGYVISVSRYRYLISLAFVAFLAFYWYYTDDMTMKRTAMFGIGMLSGAFLRDIGLLRRLKLNWPFTESVIDWKKVNEIAELQE